MLDRETLELAAKVGAPGPIRGFDHGGENRAAAALIEVGTPVALRWNPLEDDGQALRLAVKLQITVCNEHLSAGCVYCTAGADWSGPKVDARWPQQQAVVEGDYAATRRAIVRAAAAIGKAMP